MIDGLLQRLRVRTCAVARRAAAAVVLPLAAATPLPAYAALSGVVTVLDGEPVAIVRGDRLLSGAKGVTLQGGDFVETQRASTLVL